MSPIQSWAVFLGILAIAVVLYRHFHFRHYRPPIVGPATWGYHISRMENGGSKPVVTISSAWLAKQLKEGKP